MTSPFLQRYANYSDDTLIDIAVHNPSDYTDDAVAAARQLLTERGRDVDAFVRELDDEAADLRAARDRQSRLGEQSRTARLGALAEAGRAVGHCLLCERPVDDERVTYLRRESGVGVRRGDTMVRQYDVIPLPIPLCEVCERKHRPLRLLKRLDPVIMIAVFIGSFLAPLVLIWSGNAPAGLGGVGAAAFVFGPFALVALVMTAEDISESRVLRRLVRAHPKGPRLVGAGYKVVSAGGEGSRAVELFVRFLRQGPAHRRQIAEEQLIARGDSEVVAAMIGLLGHRRARLHALRVLAALRAKDAIDDIVPLTRHRSRTVRAAARSALVDMGVTGPGPQS